MLRSMQSLEGFQVRAKDGDLGSVANFLLDDETWVCRYLVVRTGGFFNERKVLISPMFFREVAWASRVFHLALTQEKIRRSPGTETDLPVSRQHERDYFLYYGYPNYWGSTGIWGLNPAPVDMAAENLVSAATREPLGRKDDLHLRSAKVLRGYYINGTDGEIGHVEDFIVDDETWQIRYMVVNTSNWWVGKKVLVPPFWAGQVSWEANEIFLGLSRQEIQGCPLWDPAAPVNRTYEKSLYDHYGRPAYWDHDGIVAQHQAPAPPVPRD